MKTQLHPLLVTLALLALSTLNPQFSTVFAQGSLTPPGAPAATMKSLAQIEPRTIVNSVNTPGDGTSLFIISQPGSYYLTTNLVGVSGKNGINIAANCVTLDLNGFALQGGPGGSSAIYILGAQTNITVRNGTISGWGSSGVYLGSVSSLNMVFERLNVSACWRGIDVPGGGVVRDCACETNSTYGIFCFGGIVSGCTADNNGSYGIYVGSGIASGCSAQNNGTYGISVSAGTMSGCFARNNGTDGISVSGGTVSGCSAQVNGTDGFYVSGGKVLGCYAYGNQQSGIYVYGSGSAVIGNTCNGNNTAISQIHAGIYINNKNNRVEDNLVMASGYAGISVSASYSGNIIIKNSVSGNGGNNYLTPGAQFVGPLITTTGTITNSNPWANFSF